MLPGQLSIPGIADESTRAKLERKAQAPLVSAKPQRACNAGLFSDDSLQTDLVDAALNASRSI